MAADATPRGLPRALPWLEAAAVALAAGLALGAVVLPAEALVTIDGFFHMKIARLMLEEGPVVDIRWLPLTLLGEHGPDQHWLWHLLLVPFATADDLFVGLKWGAVATGALVPGALTLVMRRLGVPWAWAFGLLAFAGATIMPGRLVMLRAQNLAIVLLAVCLWAMVRRRHLALGLLSLAFMEAYHGAVLLVPLVALHAGIVAARERRLPWRPGLAVAAGLLGGLVLSPWFPRNVEYLLFHTLYKTANPLGLGVGSEWYPPGAVELLAEAWPVHAALAVGLVLALARRRGRLSEDTLLWLGAAAVALVLFSRAWRFAEYYVPLGAVAAGLAFRDARRAAAGGGDAPASPARAREPRPPLRRLAWAAVPALLVAATALQARAGLATLRDRAEFRPEKYAEIARVLHAQAAPGELVCNRLWEDFVFLVWHAPDLRYVTGLDPNYLAYADPFRFGAWSWLRTLPVDEPNDPAPVVRSVLGSRWVVTDRLSVALAGRLDRSPHATLVADTRWGRLYRIDLPEDPRHVLPPGAPLPGPPPR